MRLVNQLKIAIVFSICFFASFANISQANTDYNAIVEPFLSGMVSPILHKPVDFHVNLV